MTHDYFPFQQEASHPQSTPAPSSVAADSAKLTTDGTKGGKGQGKRPWQNCLCILMSSYLLWAPAGVATVLHVWSSFNMTLGACLILPPTLLVLSATWSPHLQSAVVRVKAVGQGQF